MFGGCGESEGKWEEVRRGVGNVGEGVGKCVGCEEIKGNEGKYVGGVGKCWGRCGKMCWVWGSVGERYS